MPKKKQWEQDCAKKGDRKKNLYKDENSKNLQQKSGMSKNLEK